MRSKKQLALALVLAKTLQTIPPDNLTGITGTSNRTMIVQGLQKACGELLIALKHTSSGARQLEALKQMAHNLRTALMMGVMSQALYDECSTITDEIYSLMDTGE